MDRQWKPVREKYRPGSDRSRRLVRLDGVQFGYVVPYDG